MAQQPILTKSVEFKEEAKEEAKEKKETKQDTANPQSSSIHLSFKTEASTDRNTLKLHASYVDKTSKLARSVLYAIPPDDHMRFVSFTEQQLEHESARQKLRAVLEKEQKQNTAKWRTELKAILDDKLSIDNWSDEQIMAQKIEFMLWEQDKAEAKKIEAKIDGELKEGLGAFIKEETHKNKCKASIKKDLARIASPEQAGKCSEFQALSSPAREKFIAAFANGQKPDVSKFVDELTDDDLVSASVAHEKGAVREKLLKTLTGLKTLQQITYSPELNATGKTGVFAAIFSRAFGPQGRVTKFIEDLDAKDDQAEDNLKRFFNKKRKATYDAALVEAFLDQNFRYSKEFAILDKDQKSKLRTIDTNIVNAQRVGAQKIIEKIDLDLFVANNQGKCIESIVTFLMQHENNTPERLNVIGLITQLHIDGAGDLINAIQAGNREAILQFLTTHSDSLTDLYRIRLLDYCANLRIITIDEMQRSLELDVLNAKQQTALSDLIAEKQKDRKKQTQAFVKKLDEESRTLLYKQKLTDALTDSDSKKKVELIKELQACGVNTSDLENALNEFERATTGLVQKLSVGECFQATNHQTRLSALKAKVPDSDFIAHCVKTTASLMACVKSSDEIHDHVIYCSLPSSTKEQFRVKWATHLVNRPTQLTQRVYNHARPAQTNPIYAQSEFLDISPEVLNEAGSSILVQTADNLELKATKSLDVATADISIACRVGNAVLVNNANVGDLGASIVVVDEKGNIRVKPIAIKVNTLNGHDKDTVVDSETKSILQGVKDSRDAIANRGLDIGLGFDNLHSEDGHLFVTPLDGSDDHRLNVLRCFGGSSFKDAPESAEQKGNMLALTHVPVTTTQYVTVSDGSQTFLIQHPVGLKPEKIEQVVKSALSTTVVSETPKEIKDQGQGENKVSTDMVVKTKIVLDLEKAQQAFEVKEAKTSSVKINPVIDGEKPKLHIFAKGHNGNQTAQMLLKEGKACFDAAANDHKEEEYRNEFDRLRDVQVYDMYGNLASFGDALEDLYDHSVTFRKQAEQSRQELKSMLTLRAELKGLRTKLQTMHSTLTEKKAQLAEKKQQAQPKEGTESQGATQSISDSKTDTLREEIKQHKQQTQQTYADYEAKYQEFKKAGGESTINSLVRDAKANGEKWKNALAYVQSTLRLTRQYDAVKDPENKEQPPTLELKDTCLYRPKDLQAHFEENTRLRQNLKDHRNAGFLWAIGRGIKRLFLAAKLKLSNKNAHAWGAAAGRTERDRLAYNVHVMFQNLDSTLSPRGSSISYSSKQQSSQSSSGTSTPRSETPDPVDSFQSPPPVLAK